MADEIEELVTKALDNSRPPRVNFLARGQTRLFLAGRTFLIQLLETEVFTPEQMEEAFLAVRELNELAIDIPMFTVRGPDPLIYAITMLFRDTGEKLLRIADKCPTKKELIMQYQTRMLERISEIITHEFKENHR